MMPYICGRPLFEIIPAEAEDASDWEHNKAARWSPETGWHHPLAPPPRSIAKNLSTRAELVLTKLLKEDDA